MCSILRYGQNAPHDEAISIALSNMEALQPQQQQAEPDSPVQQHDHQQQTPSPNFEFDHDVSSPVVSVSGTRSLTDERRVSVISASRLSENPSPVAHENGRDGSRDEGEEGAADEEDQFEEAHETGDDRHQEKGPDNGLLQPNHDQLDIPDSKSFQESISSSKDSLSVHPPPVVSPLLTTHRLSTEGMDDINLSKDDHEGDDAGDGHQDEPSSPSLAGLAPRPVADVEPLSPPPVPARDVPPASTSPPTDSTATQEQQQEQPQDAAKKQDEAVQPPALPPLPTRTPTIITPPKQTAPPPPRRGGPIGWLQRVASREFTKPAPPTPVPPIPDSSSNDAARPSQSRRNTDASTSGNSRSTPQDANGIDDSRRLSRNTLKDQFYALRMREEGIPPVPALPDSEHAEDGGAGAPAAAPASSTDSAQPVSAENARMRSESLASATLSVASNGSGTKLESKMRRPSSSTNKDSVLPPLSSILNPNLPPGTVSGISKSASDASAPVNWELWQQVVNNGPSALKGANAEAFNAAIKAGIPQTIRGVIWQVLADSRNPELEEVYRELLSRGTHKEYTRSPSFSFGNGNGSNGAAPNNNSLGVNHPPSISEQPEKGERPSTDRTDSTTTTSSSTHSSVHSGTSTPTNGSAFSHVSPSILQDKSNNTPDTVTQASTESVPRRRSKEEIASLQKLEKAIKRDLGSRTSYSKYFMSQKNQDGLFGVCKAYALYDEAVGYAQGLNFIVMPLLFNMEDGEAFTLMVKLMNKYGMREMFIQGMPGLHMRLYQFERLLEDLHPALACHLKRRGVSPILYATQWFLTLFAYRFPLQLVLRIYDLIFEEGVESTILRFSVAIMMRNASTLLAMNDMSSLTTFLKEKVFDVYIDKQPSASSILESGFFGSSNGQDKEVYRADLMVQDACDIHLTPEMLKTYTREWEEQTSAQQAAAAELEYLKKTVASQAAKIRHLEEQSERSDAEHVQLVSEIVRLKVENEELMDANESMTIQVRELRNVVDKQQVEIEEKMREEMDRAMQRNSEVHSQNRAMEEQLAEMEKELVETKMKWAEVSCTNSHAYVIVFTSRFAN